MVASLAAGFATATLRTAHIAHEVLAKPAYSVSLSGFVETRDIRERTDRFVLRVTQMDGPRMPDKSWSGCGCRYARARRLRSAASSN